MSRNQPLLGIEGLVSTNSPSSVECFSIVQYIRTIFKNLTKQVTNRFAAHYLLSCLLTRLKEIQLSYIQPTYIFKPIRRVLQMSLMENDCQIDCCDHQYVKVVCVQFGSSAVVVVNVLRAAMGIQRFFYLNYTLRSSRAKVSIYNTKQLEKSLSCR